MALQLRNLHATWTQKLLSRRDLLSKESSGDLLLVAPCLQSLNSEESKVLFTTFTHSFHKHFLSVHLVESMDPYPSFVPTLKCPHFKAILNASVCQLLCLAGDAGEGLEGWREPIMTERPQTLRFDGPGSKSWFCPNACPHPLLPHAHHQQRPITCSMVEPLSAPALGTKHWLYHHLQAVCLFRQFINLFVPHFSMCVMGMVTVIAWLIHVTQGLANSFHKGPDSKYFGHCCGPYPFCPSYSSALL